MTTKSNYFNLLLDVMDRRQALKICDGFLDSDSLHTISFINAHCFNLAQTDEEYREIINSSDLLLNDGIGIKIGSYFTRAKIQENLNGTDLIPQIIQLAVLKKVTVFLLGAKEENVELAKNNLESMWPEIQIAGYHSGYFENDSEIIEKINKSGAELLVVGMGVPKQEKWINNSKGSLSNVKLAVAGGAIIDFLSGKIIRAPRIMQKTGLEWMFRLFQEPERLAYRYLVGNVVFLYRIIKDVLIIRN